MTLDLDPDATTFFETLRREHYPASRNRVPAHVMLVHRIDGDRVDEARSDLARAAADVAPFALRVGEPRSIGSGVVYDLASSELSALHARLAALWWTWLVPQDRERYRPHVVVQNKVDGETARATLARLRTQVVPVEPRAEGLRLWTYRDGRWSDPEAFGFSAL